MSTEPTEPSSHYGDDGHGAGSNAAPAQASSETNQNTGTPSSGRRRRRRRKGKGGAGAPVGESADGANAAVAASPVQSAPQQQQQPTANGQNSQSNGQGQGHGGGQNGHGQGKRKNGRKRSGGGGGSSAGSSNGVGAPQPGNSNGGQGQQRRQRQNGGAWKSRSEGPDGNREGARGGFGSEMFQNGNGNGNGGGGRKGKFGRRGPTSFVGPMDHSYRAVNGNVADGSPSTLDFRNANGNSNGNVHGRNDSRDMEPAVAMKDDAPTRIICFIEDLFVVAKMQETARKLGVKLQFAKAEKETLAAITDAPEDERPSLIVFDLNNANAKPLTVIPKLKAKLKRSTSIIGFLQQIQGDLKLKATEAGCDAVMPKGAFSQNLPNLLRRHGFDEEQDLVEA